MSAFIFSPTYTERIVVYDKILKFNRMEQLNESFKKFSTKFACRTFLFQAVQTRYSCILGMLNFEEKMEIEWNLEIVKVKTAIIRNRR